MSTVATLSVLVDADISRFQSGMNAVSNGITNAGNAMTGLGNSMSQIGQSTAAITLPIVAGLGLAVNAATEFDATMTNVNSILQLGADEAAAMNAEILNIGSSAIAGPQAVAEAYYDIVGGVTDAASRIPVLNAAIAASEAGAADLTATTNVLIGAMNSYGASAEDAGHYSDVLTATVAAGVGSMDAFAAAFPQVTGVAASMGIEFDQLGGMMALLTTKGTSAAQASTQLGAAMISLIRPSESMSVALQDIGFESGQAAVEALGLQGTYQALADAGYTNFALITNGVEAMRGAIALTSEGATEFLTNFASNIDGATAAARSVQLESASAQFSLLQSAAAGLATTIGQSLMLSLSDFATSLTPIVQSITDWVTANPQLTATIVGVVGGVAALGISFAVLGPVITGIGAAIGVLAGAFAFIGSPIGLVITAFASLIAFSGDLPILGQGLGAVGTAIGHIAGGDVFAIGELVTALGNLAAITLTALADGIINTVNALFGTDFATVTEGWGSLGGLLNTAWISIQAVLISAQLGLENAGLNVQLSIQNFILGIRNSLLQVTGIDIAPNIEFDIAATQAQIQTNIDEAAAQVVALTDTMDVTASVNLQMPPETVTVDTVGVEWSAVNAIAELTPTSTLSTDVTISGTSYDTTAVETRATASVAELVVTPTMSANVTVSALSVDTSGVSASINAALAAMGSFDLTAQANVNVAGVGPYGPVPVGTGGGAFGAPPATTNNSNSITLPSGASGAYIQSEGLMYVHANERLLNAAETEQYNRNGGRSGGGGGGGNVYNIASYGSSPMELFRMVQRASRNAAPG